MFIVMNMQNALFQRAMDKNLVVMPLTAMKSVIISQTKRNAHLVKRKSHVYKESVIELRVDQLFDGNGFEHWDCK